MSRKPSLLPVSPQLQQLLNWLAGPGEGDPLQDLIPLRKHIGAIDTLTAPLLHRLKIAELLQARAERVDRSLQPLLLEAKLPLPAMLATVAQGLIGLRADLGDMWLSIEREADPALLGSVHRTPLQICLRGLDNLSAQLTASLLVSVPTPAGLWRHAQTLFHAARDSVDPVSTFPAEMTLLDVRLKAMLALSAAQPEGLAPRELAFLADYLVSHAGAVTLDPLAPESGTEWLWIEATSDQPPVALTRRASAPGKCLFFSCEALAAIAHRQLLQLAEGAPPATIGLPPQAASSDYRNALERARLCWLTPRKRHFNRKQKNLRMEVCTQIGALWTSLGGCDATGSEESPATLSTSEWALINEGPAGYAMVLGTDNVSGIIPGCALGVRTDPISPWQICLVRWARSQDNQHVAVGLEVLAPSAAPVHLQPKSHREQQTPVTALLLPALPALNRGEAILVRRGEFGAKPFTLLQETNGRSLIVECLPGRSLVETSSVEIFEFQRQVT